MVTVHVRRVIASAMMPTRCYGTDAGYDLYASHSLVIGPGQWVSVGTGIAVELPPGTEGQIRPRSGLALDHGITVLNGPGTVDEGYRGEIRVVLMNHGHRPFRVISGMRIAQLVIQRRLVAELVEVETLSPSPRGGAGFGSTGG